MRRAIRACPVSDRCFALDNCSRVFNLSNDTVAAVAPSAYKASEAGLVPKSIDSNPIRRNSPQYDSPVTNPESTPAGGRQFPAHESHPAPHDDAVHGLVQPD